MMLSTSRDTAGVLSPVNPHPCGSFRRLVVLILCLLMGILTPLSLSGCELPNFKNNEEKQLESQWNQSIAASPAPQGWINSKDGAFRVKIPDKYLDAYDAVSGQKLPDAQVILALPASAALNGYVPALVIDHAKANSDPDVVEDTLKKDKIYKDYKDFTVLKPIEIEGLNVLSMTWKYTYKEIQMTAFMTMVSGNNHAYAIKQDVPDYALETYKPIVDTVLQTWTWNESLEKSQHGAPAASRVGS